MLNAKWASDIFSSNQKSHTGCPITLVYTVHRVRQWKVPFSTTVYYGNSWSKSHFTMLLTTAQTMVGVINNLSQILFPARGIRERSLLYYDKWPHYFLHQWYFVCKIVLTYCEKKKSSYREKLLKFKAEGREFANSFEKWKVRNFFETSAF